MYQLSVEKNEMFYTRKKKQEQMQSTINTDGIRCFSVLSDFFWLFSSFLGLPNNIVVCIDHVTIAESCPTVFQIIRKY